MLPPNTSISPKNKDILLHNHDAIVLYLKQVIKKENLPQ